MPKIEQAKFSEPLDINEKWWITKIKEMIESARFGSVEIEMTIQKKKVMTIKEHTRQSHSFYND
ncbi:MAG: hypothetical protein UW68_C0026G0018 [Candidatus Collierbacteria bacterium GW2011_GWB1_44_6]|uniref:Uncharacterized protein n=1 Tax=Candidatus Collierbacteria bacterium GW2011_GWB1_44_6 TaxID=1618384 RepID=A0A0G1ML81_9BACT|nr:MAG: hypothetical protein UW68_C0026G0018 [Candidatus Collierbacteria bacterium GW2011_GWB1_44_6]